MLRVRFLLLKFLDEEISRAYLQTCDGLIFFIAVPIITFVDVLVTARSCCKRFGCFVCVVVVEISPRRFCVSICELVTAWGFVLQYQQ